MFVHVHLDKETIERKPWLIMAIGLLGVVFFSSIGIMCLIEYRKFSLQLSPQIIDLKDLDLTGLANSKWVTLSGYEWVCDAVQIDKREIPEAWLFGQFEATQVLLKAKGSNKIIIVKFDGLEDCNKLPQNQIEGIMALEGNSAWSTVLPGQLKDQVPGLHKIVLKAGAKPSDQLWYLGFFFGVQVIYVPFTIFFYKKWRRKKGNL